MKIGIVGAGFIGRAVARLATARGHQVMLSNSRGPKSLLSTVASIGCGVGTVAGAAAFGDVVLLAVPLSSIGSIDPAPFAGKIVMDADNYYPLRDEAIPALDARETTTSELTQAHFAGARIVKAWNAILERDIEKDARPVGAPDRRALPIAGDDAAAKAVVAALFDDLGYDVVDAGPLAEGWRFERARPVYCVALDKAELVAGLAAADSAQQVEGSWRGRDAGSGFAAMLAARGDIAVAQHDENGDLAFWAGTDAGIAVTEIYRRSEGAWRLLHRQE